MQTPVVAQPVVQPVVQPAIPVVPSSGLNIPAVNIPSVNIPGFQLAVPTINVQDIAQKMVKYIAEAVAISLACKLLPGNNLTLRQLFVMAIIIALTLAIIDLFAPQVSSGLRMGVGLSIAFAMLNFVPTLVPVKDVI